MSLKVLGISTSPRRDGNSDLLLRQALSGAQQAGSVVEYLRLCDYRIEGCRECYNCSATGVCSTKDDYQPILDKMLEADRLILATPVFFMTVSAQAKLLIDRGQCLWVRHTVLHKPLFEPKRDRRGLLIAVGGSRSRKQFDCVRQPVQSCFQYLEVDYVGFDVPNVWVVGYGLYVNTLAYIYLRLLGQDARAQQFCELMGRFTVKGEAQQRHVHEGLVLRYKPYYAMWSYKVHRSERFDLVGNSLAILSGIASQTRANQLIGWIEKQCRALRQIGQLVGDLPPCLFPYIKPQDPDWHQRYAKYNRPGEYHNGGIWPFACGLYVAALVAAGRQRLAQDKLAALTELVRPARTADVEFGFNEWFAATDPAPRGQDWQTWSAAIYLYAAECVRTKTTPFFDQIRSAPSTVAH